MHRLSVQFTLCTECVELLDDRSEYMTFIFLFFEYVEPTKT